MLVQQLPISCLSAAVVSTVFSLASRVESQPMLAGKCMLDRVISGIHPEVVNDTMTSTMYHAHWIPMLTW